MVRILAFKNRRIHHFLNSQVLLFPSPTHSGGDTGRNIRTQTSQNMHGRSLAQAQTRRFCRGFRSGLFDVFVVVRVR